MILLIDNYDSFVYNLERYLIELNQTVQVVRNDKISLIEIEELNPKAIVISPGPCSPNEAGICNDLIKRFYKTIPILGVCLGHQCIGAVFGGEIIKAPKAIHGKTSTITIVERVSEVDIFKELPDSFNVMRYHSLIINPDTLPECLIPTALLPVVNQASNSKIIMAIRHKEYAVFGVQFHPESVASEHGHKILQNFIECSQSGCYANRLNQNVH